MTGELTADAPTVPLVDARLYVLPNPYRLDGRVATHPIEARGWAAQNCYVVVEGDRAIVLDTGFAVHERLMIDRLAELLTPGMTLELAVMRLGEYYGSCNVRPLVDRFGVRRLFSPRGDGMLVSDYRPEYVAWGIDPEDREAEVENVRMRGSGRIELGSGRALEIVRPPLRLLATNWMYDTGTKTMFTSDHFNYVGHRGPDGPWVTDQATALPTAQEARDFLVGTRYWWLPGARTQKIVDALDQVFEDYEVERIGPSFGQVIEGSDAVQRHVALLREVLVQFAEEPATGIDAGYMADDTHRAPMAGAR